ncbi:MAG: TonB-dependent receptor [Acidobacteria bacterium]|nr:TonB-dependent receptor [Acidobacteriota bacterium]
MASFLLALVLTLAGGSNLFAQALSQLSGTVSDTTESVVVGARVTARNTATGVAQSVSTNERGLYTLPFLQPGTYEITCELEGFKKFLRAGVVLETGGARGLDIRLEIGAVTETVEVTAKSPLLESENSTVGQLIERAAVANMPIQSRRVANLVRLMGNVVYNNESQSSEAVPNFVMGGGRSQNQMWNLDGATVQNMTLGAPLLTFNPPAETIEEFKAETSNYSAEFGRAGSGLIQMTTRSGSNTWHGAAYEFLRNDKMDTRTFFAPSKAPLRYNIFGGTVSGPIKRDKTFFFVNYEGTQRRDGQTFSSNIVPRPAEIAGDFSARRDISVLDPTTRQPFAGNIIPSSRLDPVGAAVAKLYPAPNVASDNPAVAPGANYIANASDQIAQSFITARLDHNFNQNNRVYARFNYVLSKAVSAPIFPNEFADSRAQTQENDQTIVMASWIRNLRPNLINEFRGNYGLRSNVVRAFGTGSGKNAALGIKGVDGDYFARFNLTGHTSLGSTGQQRLQLPILTRQVSDTLTWIKGRHQVRFGGEFRYSLNKDVNSPTAGGNFSFTNRASNSAVAELLLGHVNSAVSNLTKDINSRSDYMGVFIQDDWRITSRLTLNLGLRWDLDTPRWERDNRQSGFDFLQINPVAGVPGVVTFAGRDGVSKYAHRFDKNNFGPHFGFAYRVGDKTVVRAGYGLAYNGIYFGAVPNNLTSGFGQNIQITSPDGGFTRALALRDGLPALPEQTLGPGFGAVRLGAAPTTAVDFIANDQSNGYMQQYNFTVQRAISGNLVGEVSYQASLGHRLSGPNININEIPLVNGRGPARQDQALRRFPQFNNVTWISPAWGASTYHSLNVRLEKRYSNGLNLLGNFTWAKFLDTVTAGGEQGGAPNGYQHSQLHMLDKSNSNSDIRRRLIVSTVYELPFRKGGKWEIHNPLANAIFGGWGLSLITEFRDGLPYGVAEQTNTSNTFSTSQRSNILRDPALSHASRADMISRYFDVTAFAAPGVGAFGTAGRTVGFGPGSINFDGSVHKAWLLREAVKLQFRADLYNFPNRANFANPGLSRGSGDFGKITSILSGSSGRLVQLSMRLEF